MTYRNNYLENKYASVDDQSATVQPPTQALYDMPSRKRRKLFIIFSCVVMVVIFINLPSIIDLVNVVSYSGGDEITKLADGSGMSLHGRSIFYQTNPELMNADALSTVCPHDSEIILFGCYLPSSNKIYILRVSDTDFSSIAASVAAHEMLHAAWHQLSARDKESISPDLLALYHSDNTTLNDDLKPYVKTGDTLPVDEIDSFTGSEVPDSALNSSLTQYFERYFSSRELSVSANQSFKDKIAVTTQKIDTDYNQINTTKSDLDSFRSQYLDAIERQANAAAYYGDYYSYNANVDAYNHNKDIYNKKVDSYNSMIDSYNLERQNLIDTYNSFYPGKVAPVSKEQTHS